MPGQDTSKALVPVASGQPPARRPSRRAIAKLQEQKFLENGPAILDQLFTAIQKGLEARDTKIIKLAAEIYGMIESKSAVTVNNNNIAVSGGGGQRDKSFEATIRRLEARDHADRLRSDERGDAGESNIQDAEFEDLPADRPAD